MYDTCTVHVALHMAKMECGIFTCTRTQWKHILYYYCYSRSLVNAEKKRKFLGVKLVVMRDRY